MSHSSQTDILLPGTIQCPVCHSLHYRKRPAFVVRQPHCASVYQAQTPYFNLYRVSHPTFDHASGWCFAHPGKCCPIRTPFSVRTFLRLKAYCPNALVEAPWDTPNARALLATGQDARSQRLRARLLVSPLPTTRDRHARARSQRTPQNDRKHTGTRRIMSAFTREANYRSGVPEDLSETDRDESVTESDDSYSLEETEEESDPYENYSRQWEVAASLALKREREQRQERKSKKYDTAALQDGVYDTQSHRSPGEAGMGRTGARNTYAEGTRTTRSYRDDRDPTKHLPHIVNRLEELAHTMESAISLKKRRYGNGGGRRTSSASVSTSPPPSTEDVGRKAKNAHKAKAKKRRDGPGHGGSSARSQTKSSHNRDPPATDERQFWLPFDEMHQHPTTPPEVFSPAPLMFPEDSYSPEPLQRIFSTGVMSSSRSSMSRSPRLRTPRPRWKKHMDSPQSRTQRFSQSPKSGPRIKAVSPFDFNETDGSRRVPLLATETESASSVVPSPSERDGDLSPSHTDTASRALEVYTPPEVQSPTAADVAVITPPYRDSPVEYNKIDETVRTQNEIAKSVSRKSSPTMSDSRAELEADSPSAQLLQLDEEASNNPSDISVTPAPSEAGPKEFQIKNIVEDAVLLNSDGVTWAHCRVDLTPMLQVNKKPVKSGEFPGTDVSDAEEQVDLGWIDRADWDDDETLRLQLGDRDQDVIMKVHDAKERSTFNQYATCVQEATRIADGDFAALEGEINDDKGTVVFKNTKTEMAREMAISPEATNVVKFNETFLHLVEALKSQPLKRLASFDLSKLPEVLQEMRQHFKNVIPEAVAILHRTIMTIHRYGDSSPKGAVRVRLYTQPAVAMELSPVLEPKDKSNPQQNAITGMGRRTSVKTDSLPPSLLLLRNLHQPSRILDLCGTQRGVPIDREGFLVTLRNDEPRRLVVTDFASIIHRWAFGDLMDSLSYFSYVSNYTASITEEECRLARMLQERFSNTEGSGIRVCQMPEGADDEDLLHSDNWAEVHFTDGHPSWKFSSQNGQERFTGNETQEIDFFTLIRSYERVSPSFVEVRVGPWNGPVPSIDEDLRQCHHSITGTSARGCQVYQFHILKPKLHRLFGEYIKCLSLRQRLCVHLMTEVLDYNGKAEREESLNLMNRLYQWYPAPCAELARLNVMIRGERGIGDRFVPAHFNMICTRIVPERESLVQLHSVNLKNLVGFQPSSDLTAQLTVESPDEKNDKGAPIRDVYEVQVKRLTDLYALSEIAAGIFTHYGRTNIDKPKVVPGVVYRKPGARVAKTRRQRLAESSDQSFTHHSFRGRDRSQSPQADNSSRRSSIGSTTLSRSPRSP